MASSFLNLKELQLNGTLTDWEKLTRVLLPVMPKLEVVEIGYNRISHLSLESPLSDTPSKLQTLNLDGNELDDWEGICAALDRFPTCVNYISHSLHYLQSEQHYPSYPDIEPTHQHQFSRLKLENAIASTKPSAIFQRNQLLGLHGCSRHSIPRPRIPESNWKSID